MFRSVNYLLSEFINTKEFNVPTRDLNLSKYPSSGIYLDPDRAGGIRVFKFGSYP